MSYKDHGLGGYGAKVRGANRRVHVGPEIKKLNLCRQHLLNPINNNSLLSRRTFSKSGTSPKVWEEEKNRKTSSFPLAVRTMMDGAFSARTRDCERRTRTPPAPPGRPPRSIPVKGGTKNGERIPSPTTNDAVERELAPQRAERGPCPGKTVTYPTCAEFLVARWTGFHSAGGMCSRTEDGKRRFDCLDGTQLWRIPMSGRFRRRRRRRRQWWKKAAPTAARFVGLHRSGSGSGSGGARARPDN